MLWTKKPKWVWKFESTLTNNWHFNMWVFCGVFGWCFYFCCCRGFSMNGFPAVTGVGVQGSQKPKLNSIEILVKPSLWWLDFSGQIRTNPEIIFPKNNWTLLWRGLTLYRRVLGSPNHQLWDPMILRVSDFGEPLLKLIFWEKVKLGAWRIIPGLASD